MNEANANGIAPGYLSVLANPELRKVSQPAEVRADSLEHAWCAPRLPGTSAFDRPHAASAPARFQHFQKAGGSGPVAGAVGALRHGPRGRLVAESPPRRRRGADEDGSRRLAGRREFRRFGQESVAGMHGVRAGCPGDPKDVVDVRARACRAAAGADATRPASLEAMQDGPSPSANTAIADLPVSLAVRNARTAISPRLATGILARDCKALARAASPADELGQNGKVGGVTPQGAAASPLDWTGA